jgi:indole-3-glycerol phosphate synthase/phosphoribosylanthranilate isomerase
MSRIHELLQQKRQQIKLLKRDEISVPQDNRQLIWDRNTFRIIPELKRSSLSAGSIRPALQPTVLAKAFEHAGAAALSILTEENYFHGSIEDLAAVRKEVSLPLLQKDFILDEIQIAQAKQAGATFVLLIARFLEKSQLKALAKYSEEIGMNALIEITNRDDLAKIDFPVRYLGVNSRDLDTLQVDTNKFQTLREFLPDAFLIAESGINSIETVQRVIDLGYHGALIGEHFLRCPDPAAELKKFISRGGSKTCPKVKICGITSEHDAMLAIDAGASALGFIFAESPRRITPRVLTSFRNRIPKSVLCVGVFKGQTKAEIHDHMLQHGLDLGQVYDDIDPGLPFWKARVITSVSDIEPRGCGGGVRAPSLNTGDPASDSHFRDAGPQTLWDFKAEEPELSFLWNLASKQKIFALAGGLHPGNVAKAVTICNPEWVDVARGVEERPGIKNELKLRAFIKELI